MKEDLWHFITMACFCVECLILQLCATKKYARIHEMWDSCSAEQPHHRIVYESIILVYCCSSSKTSNSQRLPCLAQFLCLRLVQC